MKRSTLELVCCPACKSPLTLEKKNAAGLVGDGELRCSTCHRGYPIREGIVHFIQPQELEGSNQHFERYYNRLAPFYTLFSKLAMLPFGGERVARGEILQHLELNGGRTLEVSIGNGVNLPYLFESSQTGEVYGIDISAGMLKHCRKLTKRRGWGVDLFLGMAEELPFRDETFDNVLHIGGINFFSDKRKAVEEMARVARMSGRVVIADEVERLAKHIDPSGVIATPGEQAAPGATILNLVPGTMAEVCREGIWKVHGKHHGYCVSFTKL